MAMKKKDFRAATKALYGTEIQQPSLDPSVRCLGCGRPMVIRKRPITYSAAVTLIYLYRDAKTSGTRDFHYLEGFMKLSWAGHQRGDETKLAYWGLLEPQPSDPLTGEKARNGFWRITELGMKFVEGMELPRHSFVYDSTLYGFSDGNYQPRQMGTIMDALGTLFDLQSLLSGNWAPSKNRKRGE